MKVEKIIQQGAEAILIKKEIDVAQLLVDSRFTPSTRNSRSSLRSQAPQIIVLKRRVAKGYRIKEMDEKIRKLRTRSESKLLEKAGKIVFVPRVLKVNEKDKEIDMEFIQGLKLSENLDSLKNWKEVCRKIGEGIAKLHDEGIIHGDLTTSNLIWVSNEIGRVTTRLVEQTRSARQKLLINSEENVKDKVGGEIYFIDFGLGFFNGKTEDKAVDLHLIKQALEAKHFIRWEEYFKEFLEGYKISKNYKETIARFEKVEKRGRYKEQY